MAKFNVTGEEHFSITGQMLEIQRQIRLKGGSPIDPQLVTIALQDIIEGKFSHKKTANSVILRRLYEGESIIIVSCDGSETIVNDKDTFKAGRALGYENFGRGKPEWATENTVVEVYEVVQNAKFMQKFNNLKIKELDKLCFTQHQIIQFCKDHANRLSPRRYKTLLPLHARIKETLFPLKVKGHYCIAQVSVLRNGLYIDCHWSEAAYLSLADDLNHVVFPLVEELHSTILPKLTT